MLLVRGAYGHKLQGLCQGGVKKVAQIKSRFLRKAVGKSGAALKRMYLILCSLEGGIIFHFPVPAEQFAFSFAKSVRCLMLVGLSCF